MTIAFSTKHPAVKRLMKEAIEMKDQTEDYSAIPLNDNLFEWHFTIRGPPDSEFENGIYHGRIIFPNEYPLKPPDIMLLTPNGRFEVNKKICLSISGYHPETWQPSWSVRTALLALIAFMPVRSLGTIGSLDYPSEEKKKLAKKSHNWSCPTCGNINRLLGTDAIPVPATAKENGVVSTAPSKMDDNHQDNVTTTNKEAINQQETRTSTDEINNSVPADQFIRDRHLRDDTKLRVVDQNDLDDLLYKIFSAIIVVIVALLIFRRLYLM